jgi:hypothetical protein
MDWHCGALRDLLSSLPPSLPPAVSAALRTSSAAWSRGLQGGGAEGTRRVDGLGSAHSPCVEDSCAVWVMVQSDPGTRPRDSTSISMSNLCLPLLLWRHWLAGCLPLSAPSSHSLLLLSQETKDDLEIFAKTYTPKKGGLSTRYLRRKARGKRGVESADRGRNGTKENGGGKGGIMEKGRRERERERESEGRNEGWTGCVTASVRLDLCNRRVRG